MEISVNDEARRLSTHEMHPCDAVRMIQEKIKQEEKKEGGGVVVWKLFLQRLLGLINVHKLPNSPIKNANERSEILMEDIKAMRVYEYGNLQLMLPASLTDEDFAKLAREEAAKEADKWDGAPNTSAWAAFAAFWEWLFKPRK